MIVDVNVNLSQWPLRRLPCDETPRLVAKLKQHGVAQAWAGSFEGLLHRDIAGVNARLADECRRRGEGLLLPFGSINPMLPDWAEDVRRCQEDLHMPGIRLHPNYHGYALTDAVFSEVLAMAEQRGLIVQLAARMDDVRVQHPLMRVPDVDLRPLGELLAKFSRIRLVLLNGPGALRGDARKRLGAARNLWMDIATVEGVGGIAAMLQEVPAERVVFGSHCPLFSLESALLKMRESEMSDQQAAAIFRDNARRLLAP